MAHKILKVSALDLTLMAQLPTGWFKEQDVSIYVKNRRYRCERLLERGMLETRVVGEFPNLSREWRRINTALQGNSGERVL